MTASAHLQFVTSQQATRMPLQRLPAHTTLPQLTHTTMECLLQLSQPQSGASPGDQELALELLAMAAGDGTAAEHAVVQRLNLISKLFDQLHAETQIPASCRQLLEHARYPMMKNILVDGSFLTLEQHPLRQILHTTLLTAFTICTKGNQALRQLEQRLQDLPGIIDLSANFVTPGLRRLQGLSDEQVRVFESQLAEQAKEREQSLKAQAARLVTRELDEMTLGLKLPHGVVNFLQFAINPLLTAILLKHGMDSVRWTAEMSRVQNLLASYEPANAVRATDRSGIISNLVLDLISIGMPQERIQMLLILLNASPAH